MRSLNAILAALVLITIFGCGDDARQVRTPGYFTAYVAAAEHRLRAPAKPTKKDVGPPADLFEALPTVDYQEARRLFYEEKKPMLIILHAEWCGPCNRMIRGSLPRVKNLDRVSLVLVDIDEEPELKKKLTDQGSVPQIILFYYDTKPEAAKKSVIGAQSAEQIEELIDANTLVPEVQK